MIPDKTYRIEPVTVYRLVDDEGKVVLTEDDYGEYPWHFDTYTEACMELAERRKLPFHGPKTEEEQKSAYAWSKLTETMRQYYSTKIMEIVRPLPECSEKTITFHKYEEWKQDEGFVPGVAEQA